MLYLTMLASAFLAATIVPFASEVTLAAALLRPAAPSTGCSAAATLGNTLGATVNWGLGRYVEHFRDRRWFPADAQQLERAQTWFRRYGSWSLLFAWVPVVGEPLTVIAGAMRVRILPFVILVAAGKTLRYIVLALTVDGVIGT